jgi:hypothetical protein
MKKLLTIARDERLEVIYDSSTTSVRYRRQNPTTNATSIDTEISGVQINTKKQIVPSNLQYAAELRLPCARLAGIVRDLKMSGSVELLVEVTPERMTWSVANIYGVSTRVFLAGQHVQEDRDYYASEKGDDDDDDGDDDDAGEREDETWADADEREHKRKKSSTSSRSGGGGRDVMPDDGEEYEDGETRPSRQPEVRKRKRRSRGEDGDAEEDGNEDGDRRTHKRRHTKKKKKKQKGASKKDRKSEAKIAYRSTGTFTQQISIKCLSKFLMQPKISLKCTISFDNVYPCRISYVKKSVGARAFFFISHQNKGTEETV